jgi:hypothetical protein
MALRLTQALIEMSTWGVKSGRPVRLTTSSPTVSELPRKCVILNIPQPHRHPRPVTVIA